MAQAEKRKKSDKKLIHYLVVTILVFGGNFLPQIGPVTPLGGAILSIFIGVIYGYTFLDMIWPSVLGVVGLGYTVGMQKILSASFGSPIMPMMILTFAGVTLLKETKLTDVLIRGFLTNRFTKGHPWIFIFFFFFLGGYFCSRINVFVAMILLTGVLIDIFRKLNVKPYSILTTIMFSGLALSIQLGQVMLPFKGSGLTLVAAYGQIVGGGMPNFAQYMLFVIPMSVLMLLFYVLICRFVFHADASPFATIPDEIFGEAQKLNREQKIAICYFVGMIVMMLSTSILPEGWAITKFLTRITIFGQAAIVILILMLVRNSDGTKFFNYSVAASKGMSWDGFFLVAFILPITSLLTADDTGIKEAISLLLAPLNDLSPIIFMVVMMLILAIITNLANNVVLATASLPIAITFAMQMGIPPLGMACMIFVSTQLALFTPGASPLCGMAFSQSEWVRVPMMMKYGLLSVIMLVLFFMLVAIPYMYLVF